MNARHKPGIAARLREHLATLRHYHEVAEVGEIARRYFAMNAFDGVLTTIGVLAGAYVGGVDSARAVVSPRRSRPPWAMGVSGFYGATSSSAPSATATCATSRNRR